MPGPGEGGDHRPARPDGWQAMVEAVAVGRRGIRYGNEDTTAATLWCKPGEGYSYATSSAHLASMVVRHVGGMELEDYVRKQVVALCAA